MLIFKVRADDHFRTSARHMTNLDLPNPRAGVTLCLNDSWFRYLWFHTFSHPPHLAKQSLSSRYKAGLSELMATLSHQQTTDEDGANAEGARSCERTIWRKRGFHRTIFVLDSIGDALLLSACGRSLSTMNDCRYGHFSFNKYPSAISIVSRSPHVEGK